MPQKSIYYALGRIGALDGNTLNKQKLDRLLQSQTMQDAHRVLAEIGWAEVDDIEKAAAEHVNKACKLVRDLAVNEKTLDCFLMRYDVNNLKILLKARSLSISTDSLSTCGTIDVDALRHAVTEHNYHILPIALKKAMNDLEKMLAVEVNPLQIDVKLDQALFAHIMMNLPKNDKVAKKYFTAQIDLTNYIMALRALNIQKSASFFETLFIAGGNVSKNTFLRKYEQPEYLPQLVRQYGATIFQAALAAQMAKDKLPNFERTMDDYLMGLYLPFKRVIDKNERLIGYLLKCQREAAAIKLIIAGKLGGFPKEIIQERLRELYG